VTEAEVDPYAEYGAPSGAYAESLRKSAERREARLFAKAQTEHSAPMVGTPQEREERDKQKQMARYLKSLTVRKQELLQGPHGEHFARLVKFLDQMDITTAPELIEAVKNSVWLSDTDQTAKNDALWLIDSAIIKLRIREGLPPFDDPLWDQPPNAFEIIRHHLTGVGHL
jgi:hypothetical protein